MKLANAADVDETLAFAKDLDKETPLVSRNQLFALMFPGRGEDQAVLDVLLERLTSSIVLPVPVREVVDIFRKVPRV
jgi:hypothetical protein